jgi:hypothetical protein
MRVSACGRKFLPSDRGRQLWRGRPLVQGPILRCRQPGSSGGAESSREHDRRKSRIAERCAHVDRAGMFPWEDSKPVRQKRDTLTDDSSVTAWKKETRQDGSSGIRKPGLRVFVCLGSEPFKRRGRESARSIRRSLHLAKRDYVPAVGIKTRMVSEKVCSPAMSASPSDKESISTCVDVEDWNRSVRGLSQSIPCARPAQRPEWWSNIPGWRGSSGVGF